MEETQVFEITVSFIKVVFNRSASCPLLLLFANILKMYSRGTDIYLDVPFCISVREQMQFILLSFLLLIGKTSRMSLFYPSTNLINECKPFTFQLHNKF